ncbi:bifunctional folylpolyglutamate synthase/dihydrofolate synthase [Streptococcus caprae]|uniref:Bifunctional folylpolyglutamate synthase/dihydrofolate synthase n=1 Tax=Streptococcus caprae TaxID=1640501 RepID=A0ABV8CVX8_9STRE
MDYQESLDWIHQQLKFGIKPGLERVKWLLNELGNPQKKVQAVHVVGTNGKGSTVNYLQTIFTKAGYEVGTFVSPYIMDFRERISINGIMIAKDEFVAMANDVRPIVERLPLETEWEPATEFEIITVLMFEYFGNRHPVDIAFIEAGLGGLYDSTNVFHPLAVICPSIGLDHQAILGETYKEIAEQKAGVLKSQVPFIYAVERDDVRRVFEETAASLSCPTYELGKDFKIREQGSGFVFAYGDDELTVKDLAMLGHHQMANASLVIMACLLLRKNYSKVTDQVILSSLTQAKWLGRTELIRDNLMIDGAHNKESVVVLVDLLKTKYADREVHILFAAIDGKPVDQMLEQLAKFSSLTVTTFDYPSSLTLDRYPASYEHIESWQEWLETVYDESNSALYVVTGSLYFISAVRHYLLEQAD